MPTKVCRYIRTNGERCGSPALTSEVFCYFHIQLGKSHRNLRSRPERVETIIHPMTLQDGQQRDPLIAEYSIEPAAPLQLDFPPLEDRHSIQLALSMLITAMAQNRLDPKRAAMLLYGLQVASANAKDLIPVVPPHNRLGKVRQTVVDASGALIAPDEDPDPEDGKEYQSPGPAARLLEEIERKLAEKKRKAAEATTIQLPLPPV